MSGEKPSDLTEAIAALCWAYRAHIALGNTSMPFEVLLEAFEQDLVMSNVNSSAYAEAFEALKSVAGSSREELVGSLLLVRPQSPTAILRRTKHH